MDFLKKLDNEDKLLIGAGLVSAGILGFMYWRKKKAEREAMQAVQPEIENQEPPKIPQMATPPIAQTTSSLNRSLTLKKGSKGSEVRALQKKLGVEADGDFGSKTESALVKAKGVKSISLEKFDAKASFATPQASSVVTTIKIPKVGAKLMAIKDDFNIFNAVRNADGSYTNSGANGTFTTFKYGEEVGTFKTARKNGQFLIAREGKLYFVNGANVKAF
jgi:hypothetical protein